MALGLFWALSMGVAGVSSALLVGLLYVYVGNHRQLRSPFTLGLVFFASLLLVENLASIYFYFLMNEAREGPAVAVPMLALGLVQVVAFGALFCVTWR